MFQGYLTAMMDLAGSLSVICLLSLAYGSVRRRLPGVTLAPQLLGALFGFVAVLQMHTPISPVPGMIIDLRVVPIVLAGAFLGGRGVLICLMIAVAGRAAIGGVGVSSGIVSMMLAGGAGLAWDRMTTGPKRRGGWTMAALVAMTSVNFVAVVMLPYELMMWFLTWAFAPLLATYAVTIPLVGTLLERERVLMASEARLRAAAQADPETGFPSRATLETQLSQALANGLFDRGVAVLRMTFKPGLAQASFWGDDVEDLVALALHHRIAPLLPDGAMIGQVERNRVVIVAPQHTALGMDGLAASIRREVSTVPIKLPGAAPSRPQLDVTRADQDGLPDLGAILDPVSKGTRPEPPPILGVGDGSGDRRLFEVAERLIAHHRDRPDPALRARADQGDG